MEKRWTRKKRARRDAGGPEPKPALSGDFHMVESDVSEMPPESERPVRRRRPMAEAEVEIEANPVTAEPAVVEDPVEPAPETLPPTATVEPETVAPELEAAAEANPDDAETPSETEAPAEPAVDDATPTVDAPAPEAPAPAPDPLILTGAEVQPAPRSEETASAHPQPDPAAAWKRLGKFPIDARKLERNRIITATRKDPVHTSFDVLRTKLLRALRDNGWTRVAVTSPTEGCGKTFMAANLALSLSRQSNCRTVILDLDMRHPTLARVMDIQEPPAMGDFLRGRLPVQDVLRRPARNPHKIGENVAFGVNTRREDYAAELLQDPVTAAVLDNMEQTLAPDVILFDMPPALVNDDVLAARPLYDGIILIVGGGMTKPQQVRDVERRLGTDTPLLGVVLNKSEDDDTQIYGY